MKAGHAVRALRALAGCAVGFFLLALRGDDPQRGAHKRGPAPGA